MCGPHRFDFTWQWYLLPDTSLRISAVFSRERKRERQSRKQTENFEIVVTEGEFPGQNSSSRPAAPPSLCTQLTHPLLKHPYKGRVVPQKYSLAACMLPNHPISSQHSASGCRFVLIDVLHSTPQQPCRCALLACTSQLLFLANTSPE